MIVAPRSCIRIPQIQPKRPFLLKHPPHLSEDLYKLAYVGFRALLQANLPIYSIVSQSESKEARSHSNQLTRSEVFLIPPARPPAEPGYSSINSPLMFILLCTNHTNACLMGQKVDLVSLSLIPSPLCEILESFIGMLDTQFQDLLWHQFHI